MLLKTVSSQCVSCACAHFFKGCDLFLHMHGAVHQNTLFFILIHKPPRRLLKKLISTKCIRIVVPTLNLQYGRLINMNFKTLVTSLYPVN
ncbi:hypothetical protein FKM82_001215 [Ascaphus truei]